MTALNQPGGFTAISVFVDEITPAGLIRQSIAMPQSASGIMHACTLNADQYALEGQGSLSVDGQVFMFGTFKLLSIRRSLYDC